MKTLIEKIDSLPKELQTYKKEILASKKEFVSISLEKFIPSTSETYAVIFGNEVKGVSQEVVSESDEVIEIPQFGTKHSLNISVSAGVVIWDLFSKLNQK